MVVSALLLLEFGQYLINMKNRLLFVFAIGFILSSCETTEPQNVNTERFYSSPWNVELKRTHGAIGLTPAAEEDHNGCVTLDKMGSMTFDIAALNDHRHQNWGYSWSTDQFFMNWSPCLEWYINEGADSMFINYDHHDYDVNTGNSFYWNYSVHMTK